HRPPPEIKVNNHVDLASIGAILKSVASAFNRSLDNFRVPPPHVEPAQVTVNNNMDIASLTEAVQSLTATIKESQRSSSELMFKITELLARSAPPLAGQPKRTFTIKHDDGSKSIVTEGM